MSVSRPTEAPWHVDVNRLLSGPGQRRRIRRSAVIEGLGTSVAVVVEGTAVDADLVIDRAGGEIVVTGTVTARWRAECRRCLEAVGDTLVADVREVYSADAALVDAAEAYPLTDEGIDLEPLVRDAVLLGLPLAPLCSADCRGPVPGVLTLSTDPAPPPARDPRWAALDGLRLDDG